ncbi:MAG: flagellar biosynthetic protein FliO [Cellvibrionaceae bacterium]|nr:flagellar biosynthetic protein FliO [Cellvibrionaceae bacterium]
MTLRILAKSIFFLPVVYFLTTSLPAWSSPDKLATNSVTSILAVKVIIGLTLTVILIGAFAWLAKKLGYANVGTQQCQMKILGNLPLGTREKAVMVDAAGKILLLGVSTGSVTALYTFSEQEKKDILADIQGNKVRHKASSLPQNFSQVLKSLAANRKGKS